MNPTRNGKIAHLPLTLRTELNHRLDNGVPGRELLSWLNADPDVQRMVTDYFQGYRITQQNLSEWRCGGYQDWVKLQETRHLTLQLAKDPENSETDIDPKRVINAFTRITTTEFMQASQSRLRDCTNTEQRWKHVCDMTTRLSNLRRDDHRAACLAFEQEKHDYEASAEKRAAAQAAETEARRQVLASLVPPDSEMVGRASSRAANVARQSTSRPSLQSKNAKPSHPESCISHPVSAPHDPQNPVKNAQFPSGTHPNARKKFLSIAGRADLLPPIIGVRPNIKAPANNLRSTQYPVPPSNPAPDHSRITHHVLPITPILSLTLADPATMYLEKPVSTLLLPADYQQKPCENPAISKSNAPERAENFFTLNTGGAELPPPIIGLRPNIKNVTSHAKRHPSLSTP